MRHFNTVSFTATLLVLASFSWSIGRQDISAWGTMQHFLGGSAIGWAVVTTLLLAVLALDVRWRMLRRWLRFVLAAVSPLWLAITLALRGEWFILIMLAVSTAILVLLATPGSPKSSSSNADPDAWRRKLKNLFIEPDPGVDPDATTTWK